MSTDSKTRVLSSAIIGGVAAACLIATLLLRRTTRKKKQIHDDAYYLQLCHFFRLRLEPPRHSGFRVVALLLLENQTVILGANDEASPCIAGALCAERAALLQYRIRYGAYDTERLGRLPKIVAIYIVSDHPKKAITPGCLCREYLYGHPALDPTDLRIVLQSADQQSAVLQLSLPELYPYPSVTARCNNTTEAIQMCKQLQSSMKWDAKTNPHFYPLYWSRVVQPLWQAAQNTLSNDDYNIAFDRVHPIRYGAAAAVETKDDLKIITAAQATAFEYGCTQDAVSQLIAAIRQFTKDSKVITSIKILGILQVDQFGIPHAPFAAARSFLVEHGYGNVPVIVATAADGDDDTVLKVEAVPAASLAPRIPEIHWTTKMERID